MSSLTSLITKTRDEYQKIDRTGKVRGDTILASYINRAYFKMQQDAKFELRECDGEATLTIVDGKVNIPSDFISIDEDGLIRPDGAILNRIEKKDFNGMVSGEPTLYYIQGNTIGFNTNTGTVILYYRKRLPNITATQDSILSSDFDDAIATYATYLCFMSVNKLQEAQAKIADYDTQKAQLLVTYLFYDNNITWG